MSTAVDHLTRAAAILEALPARDAGCKYAQDLFAAGVIPEADIEKHARILEDNYRRDPQAAETIFHGMLAGGQTKAANLGEPVGLDHPSGYRGQKLDELCLGAAHRL